MNRNERLLGWPMAAIRRNPHPFTMPLSLNKVWDLAYWEDPSVHPVVGQAAHVVQQLDYLSFAI